MLFEIIFPALGSLNVIVNCGGTAQHSSAQLNAVTDEAALYFQKKTRWAQFLLHHHTGLEAQFSLGLGLDHPRFRFS